jgi:3-hydroxyacyl-CoA dehydrogenase
MTAVSNKERRNIGGQCVPESLSLKRSLLRKLDKATRPETIIASNSSSYNIPEIAKGIALKGKDRIVNMHPCKYRVVVSDISDNTGL